MVTVNRSFVEFRFLHPGAKQVHLVGDFTSWRSGELPMHRAAKGYWSTRVQLPGGCFRFRYCADGQWFTDFAAFGIEPGPDGPIGIVYVPSGPQQERAVPLAAGRAKEVTSCLPAKSHTN
jgi:1,4-alpha-glucan branching enzyme